MPISKEKADAVVDDFDYLSDNLPSATKKLDELLSDYKRADSDGERAKVLKALYDVVEEVQKYASDALESYDGIADDVGEVLGIE